MVHGVGVVQHQVHNVGGARAEVEGEETGAPDAGTEKDEELWQQAGWGRAAKGRGQPVPESGQEGAPEELRVEQAGEPGGHRH